MMKQILDGAYWYDFVGNTHSKYWYVIREKRPSEREYINSILFKKIEEIKLNLLIWPVFYRTFYYVKSAETKRRCQKYTRFFIIDNSVFAAYDTIFGLVYVKERSYSQSYFTLFGKHKESKSHTLKSFLSSLSFYWSC